ncbi:BofC C-terminal domain-containing protein [Candidatus Allofournierella excrementigallinarum]|uniref:BofC C-terminal domain-containing protein n=1 Tax=Candidatus Allofournierella excrementigallinarum TaxID=2838592 RepID=UPI00374E7A90
MTKVWVSLLAVACAASLGLSLFWMARPARTGPESAFAAPYILKDHGGRLAVFASEGGEPLQVYDVYIHLLPEGDVAALQKGIPVESEERLDRLLEDFGA